MQASKTSYAASWVKATSMRESKLVSFVEAEMQKVYCADVGVVMASGHLCVYASDYASVQSRWSERRRSIRCCGRDLVV